MIFKPKPRFDQLDSYLAKRDYISALEAISEEIKQRPENFNLLLRQAEILGLAGDRDRAIEVYRQLAEHYTGEGFYARAIAVTNKILRLDPSRKDVSDQLAEKISSRQEEEQKARERLNRSQTGPQKLTPAQPAPAAAQPPAAEEQPEQAAAPAAGTEQEERERAASRFFEAFPRPALDRLLASTSVLSFEPGQGLMREGEPGESMFLIADGNVDVLTADPTGRSLPLARLGPGEFFGEVAMLTGRPRTATVVAVDRVTVIELSGEDLSDLMKDFPVVREIMHSFLERRAQATIEAVLARMRGGGG